MTTNWRAVSHVISGNLLEVSKALTHTKAKELEQLGDHFTSDHKYQSSFAKQNNTVRGETNMLMVGLCHP